MIRLASVIATFEADFLAQYRDRLRPEHARALAAMKHCRTPASPKMQVKCTGWSTTCSCSLAGRRRRPSPRTTDRCKAHPAPLRCCTRTRGDSMITRMSISSCRRQRSTMSKPVQIVASHDLTLFVGRIAKRVTTADRKGKETTGQEPCRPRRKRASR